MNDLDFGIGPSGKLRAFLLVALAVFMAAIGFGILEAPMNMKPILGYLLKAFILFVFGGIAAFCILHAVRTVRGDRRFPPDLLARCLTCGEYSPNDLVCPVCDEPPRDRANAFGSQPDEFWGQAFAATILTGVGCLGLFIMIGPYFDGERRWWALIAFFALGLLMFVVGAAGFFGFILASWNQFKGAKTISFSCQSPDRAVQGTGKIAWGKLIGLQGKGCVKAPLAARGRNEGGYRVSPGDLLLAEAIATFDAAGLLELRDVTVYDWRVGDPSGKTRTLANEFVRTIEPRIIVALSIAPQRYIDDENEDDPEVRPVRIDSPQFHEDAIWRYLARYLAQPTALLDFKSKLDADPVHRTQVEMHARVLRDRGIVVSNVLVEAVLEALLRENAPHA